MFWSVPYEYKPCAEDTWYLTTHWLPNFVWLKIWENWQFLTKILTNTRMGRIIDHAKYGNIIFVNLRLFSNHSIFFSGWSVWCIFESFCSGDYRHSWSDIQTKEEYTSRSYLSDSEGPSRLRENSLQQTDQGMWVWPYCEEYFFPTYVKCVIDYSMYRDNFRTCKKRLVLSIYPTHKKYSSALIFTIFASWGS